MKFLREKLIRFLFDSYRELKSEMEYCQGLHRFASSWIRNGSPSNDIGSIFLGINEEEHSSHSRRLNSQWP